MEFKIEVVKKTSENVYFACNGKIRKVSLFDLTENLYNADDETRQTFTKTATEVAWSDVGYMGSKSYVEVHELIKPNFMDKTQLELFIQLEYKNNKTFYHALKNYNNTLIAVVYQLHQLAKKYDTLFDLKITNKKLDIYNEYLGNLTISKNKHFSKALWFFYIEGASFADKEFTKFVDVADLINFLDSQIKARK